MGCPLYRSWKYSLKILHIISSLGIGVTETIITFVGQLAPAEANQQLRNARNCLTTAFVEGIQYHVDILKTGTDCGFCPPLPSGEGWGEGFQKSVNRDRLQYNMTLFCLKFLVELHVQAIPCGWPKVARYITEWKTTL
jgi:hypothetical protein